MVLPRESRVRGWARSIAGNLEIARREDPALTHLAVVGDTHTVLLSGEQTAGRFAMLDMLIPPWGFAAPPRLRRVLPDPRGLARGAYRGLPPVRLETGESANIPANAPHVFRNPGDVPARLLCMVAPSGLEKYFAEFGDPVPTRISPAPPLGDAERQERLRRAIAKAPDYGVEILPTPGTEERSLGAAAARHG